MPADVTQYENGQLLDILADPDHFLWDECLAEINNRVNAVTDLRTKKGFDTPNPPQIP